MYEIHFYKDRSGREPVKEYIAGLASRKDKDSRMGRQRFCTPARFYEADAENATARDRAGKEEFIKLSGKGK